MAALVALLITALIVIVVAYVIILIVDMIPGLPAQAYVIVKLLIGVIALIIILERALPLLGVSGTGL